MTLITIYIILLWIANAWHDADYYKENNAHFSGAVFACLSVLGLFMFSLVGLVIRDFNDFINLVFLTLSLRWIVFDISYNIFISQKWYFTGTTSTIDIYLPNWVQFGLKLILLFFSVLIFASFFNYIGS
jgi:hypothetical protein